MSKPEDFIIKDGILKKYIGSDAKVVIPECIECIGDYAFIRCETITEISIPDSVTKIRYRAFYGCTNLTSITIPDNVISIEREALSETGYYHNADNWVNDVLYIGNHLIEAKDSISGDYEIKSGTKHIAYDAFERCTSLKNITIPDSVTSVGHYAFENCTGLTSVTIGNNVTSIGRWAFSGCTDLTSITVKSGNTVYDSRNNCNAIIEKISNTLIYGCKNTVIPDGITSIDDGAFLDCAGLTGITIPDSVTSIGDSAFRRCSGLTSITIPDSTTYIGGSAFEGCCMLKKLILPDTIKEIDQSAFFCLNLDYIRYPRCKFKSTGFGYTQIADADADLKAEWELLAELAHTFSNKDITNEELAYLVVYQKAKSWMNLYESKTNSRNINDVIKIVCEITKDKKKFSKTTTQGILNICSKYAKYITVENANSCLSLLQEKAPDAADKLLTYKGLFDEASQAEPDVPKVKDNCVTSKSFVLSGLANEDEIGNYIKSLGGIVKTSISSKTDFFIYNPKYVCETEKYRDAIFYIKNGSLKAMTCDQFKRFLSSDGIVPDPVLDKGEELYDISTPDACLNSFNKIVALNIKLESNSILELYNSEIYEIVDESSNCFRVTSSAKIEEKLKSYPGAYELWMRSKNKTYYSYTDYIENGYSVDAIIPNMIALRLFVNPDYCIKIRVYRDKWEERGDYPGMSSGDVLPAVYWEISDEYPYGRWSYKQYDKDGYTDPYLIE